MSKVRGVVVEDDDALVRDHVGRRRAFGCDAERVRDAEHEREPGQFRKRNIVSPHSILPAAIPRLERLKEHPAPRKMDVARITRGKNYGTSSRSRSMQTVRSIRKLAPRRGVGETHAPMTLKLHTQGPRHDLYLSQREGAEWTGRIPQDRHSRDRGTRPPAGRGRRFWFSWAALVRTRKLLERAPELASPRWAPARWT